LMNEAAADISGISLRTKAPSICFVVSFFWDLHAVVK
jgi:hypothetical protein